MGGVGKGLGRVLSVVEGKRHYRGSEGSGKGVIDG